MAHYDLKKMKLFKILTYHLLLKFFRISLKKYPYENVCHKKFHCSSQVKGQKISEAIFLYLAPKIIFFYPT